jgi:hypothetical protein
MSLRDDLFTFAGTAARVGLDRASRFVEDLDNERKVRDFDDKLNKAAASARASGKDGTHALQPNAAGAPARDPKAVHFDPFDLVAAMGYRERPTALTYSAMEMVGRGMPVVADVVNTRVKQISMFCELPEDRHSPGFRVRNRDWRTKAMTKVAEKEARRLEQLLLHTGHFDPNEPHKSVSLRSFCSMFMADSLIFDQGTFEIVPDRKGRPSYLSIVDPATIRLLDPASRRATDPYAVQVINGAIVESFDEEELAFCIRNPRSGIRSFGYGTSEIETLVREITGFLWGMDYNRRFFSQGSATKGVLNFKGTIPDKHLQAFRRQWYAMVSGVSNAWRTPITNADELQWINMQMSNRDMEYSSWMDFLIKIVCARYNIATEEVNFSYGNTGQSQAMGTAPIEDKLKASKDLGLRPLVRWFFNCMNIHYIQRLNPDFEVVPYGLDSKGMEGEIDLLQKQTKYLMTVNEARAQAELPPLPDEQGDVILDPTWLQYVQGKEAMAEDEGFGDEEGGEEGDWGGAEEEGDEPALPPNDADGYDSETGFGVSDEEGPAPFDIKDDEAIKSERNSRVLVQYTVDLDAT